MEEVDMSRTLIFEVVALIAIVALTTLLTLSLFLLFLGNTLCLFLSVTTGMTMHNVDILNTETSGKDSNLHLLAKLWVGGKSPLYFEVTELCHKVVDVVHLFHAEDLDNDNVIAKVETSPTYKRTKEILESIHNQSVGVENSEDKTSDDKQNEEIQGTIKFA